MNLLIVSGNKLFDAVLNHYKEPNLIPVDIRDAMNDWVNVVGETDEVQK